MMDAVDAVDAIERYYLDQNSRPRFSAGTAASASA